MRLTINLVSVISSKVSLCLCSKGSDSSTAFSVLNAQFWQDRHPTGHLVRSFFESNALYFQTHLQVEEKIDQVKRTLADMENLRQRSARQAESTQKFAIQVSCFWTVPLFSNVTNNKMHSNRVLTISSSWVAAYNPTYDTTFPLPKVSQEYADCQRVSFACARVLPDCIAPSCHSIDTCCRNSWRAC